MEQDTLLILAAIGFIGICCQWLAWRVKLPSIIFLLLAGILAGPVSGYVRTDELFGDLLFPIVSLGVAVILFEGGLTLRLHEIKGVGGAVRNLLTIGVVLTWGITAWGAHLLLAFPWELALLFGALMTVTGPTVIKPLLRAMHPKAEIASVLHWEGIILDAVGAILTILVFQFIVSEHARQAISITFASMVLTGILAGAAGAWLLAFLLRRHLIPHYLHHVFSLVLVLMVFALSNTVQHESGLLAVVLMGMMLANMKDVDIEDILFFKESLSVMLISVLFIVLAARLEFAPLLEIGWAALGLLAVIMLLARPASVLASTLGSNLNWRARALLCWVAPRGIVAAAVSALIALRLEELGHAQAGLLVPLTFLVIIGTVLVQGVTARPLARWLKVMEPEPRGVLIVGANQAARAVAKALKDQGFSVKVADTGWENISAARMEGLDTYFGRIVSEHADRHMELVGIGKLLAISPHGSLNALACTRFRSEFGPGNIFRLQTSEEHDTPVQKATRPFVAGRQLFAEDVTFAKLASLLSQGAEIRVTLLTDEFDFSTYQERYRNRAIPLFALDSREMLHFFTTDKALSPEAGWKVASLLPFDVLEYASDTSSRKAAKKRAEQLSQDTGEAD